MRGRITDKLGGYTDYITTVTVTDVAPTPKIAPPSALVAGAAAAFTGSAASPSTADTNIGFTFAWNFGDGSTGTGASVSHTYAAAGTYTVTLSATDADGGLTGSTTASVTVSSSQSYSAILDDGQTGFTETGSGWVAWSAGYNGEQQYNSSAPGVASASWQLTGLPAGVYTVQATWTDSANHTSAAAYSIYDGSTLLKTVVANQAAMPNGPSFGGAPFQALANVQINSGTITVVVVSQAPGDLIADAVRVASGIAPPAATFSGPSSVNEGTSTATVTFTNQAGGTGGYTYSYDFGNTGTFEISGSTSASAVIPESYVDDGPSTLVVRGRISDSMGNVSDYTRSITINDVSPTPSISGPFSAETGSPQTFKASAASPSTADTNAGFTYAWKFGDGTTASGASVSHIYATAGTYTVTLTATDDAGGVGTTSSSVNVSDEIVTPYLTIPDFGAHPTIYSTQSGDWSNPTTWSLGRVPRSSDIVDVSPGTTITYDVNDASDSIPLNTVEVKATGTLTFRTDINTQICLGNFVVLQGGSLIVGTAANPIAANVVANIDIANQAINTTIDPSQYGTGLIVLGTVTMHGEVKTAYATVSQAPMAGDVSLHFASAVTGWRVGDDVEVPDTRELNYNQRGSQYVSQTEQRQIASISPDGLTVTLNAPLVYNHAGGTDVNGVVDYLPQVMNTSRNIMVESQSFTGMRGYTLFTQNAQVDIEYAGFCELGRTTTSAVDNTTYDGNGDVTHVGTNQSERYATTLLDLIGPATPQANGYQFSLIGNEWDNDGDNNPQNPSNIRWALALKNSHYGLIQNNDVYAAGGAGIVTESGNESYNVFDHNFILKVVDGTGQRGSGDLGLAGDGFWFAGPYNYVTNNIVSELDVNGPYGYAYEYYAIAGTGSTGIGYLNIPAHQGADPSQAGQFQSVDVNLQPLLQFQGNTAYGAAPMGLSFWWINFDPAHNATPLANGGVIKNFVTWNMWSTGIYGYEATNITIDGFVDRGDASVMASGNGASGMQFSDYFTGGLVVQNSDIQGQAAGIIVPVNVDGTVTVKNTYLANLIDVEVPAMWTVAYRADYIPPRKVILDTDTFAAGLPGQAFTAINMDWYTQNQLTSGTINVTQLDQVLVYNYNGVTGDNFQVYYTQQAASFIVPQTVLNSNGTPKLEGAPVAGLTNAQTWALYGVAIAGAVAPSTATTMNNINGLVVSI
jgi:PKD repeat protein